MRMNKTCTIAAILALSAIMLAPAMALNISDSEISAHGTSVYDDTLVHGTRAGEIGWQYDSFTQNLDVNVTPESITTLDQITVTITSVFSDVWIKQASLYGVVYPDDGFQFPISFPFFKVDTDSSTFRYIIEPFSQFSAYDIEFYIVAYDYFNTPMDSRSSNLYFEYSAIGSGWKHDTFDENIELTYWPLKANATEEVEITLRSRDNITIKGANLWVIYETPEGDVEEGGWNFSKANVNSTEMRQTIPGYGAGTNITFWVIAWDDYNVQVTSKFYNYSVMGIVEYTDFPFEYSDDLGNKDVWIPDDVITLSMAGICALGIPLIIYLYAVGIRRKKRAEDMIMKRAAVIPTEEVVPGEEDSLEAIEGADSQTSDSSGGARSQSSAEMSETFTAVASPGGEDSE